MKKVCYAAVLRIRILIGFGFDGILGSGSGSGFRRAKIILKNRKKLVNFIFCSAVLDVLF
jgi:hypothetical protein